MPQREATKSVPAKVQIKCRTCKYFDVAVEWCSTNNYEICLHDNTYRRNEYLSKLFYDIQFHYNFWAPNLEAEALLNSNTEKNTSYKKLDNVLFRAYQQASAGKGKDRHAQDGEEFSKQPMLEIARRLGDNSGPLFQAAKKIYESKRLTPDSANRELLGAIVYIAGAIILNDEEIACGKQ